LSNLPWRKRFTREYNSGECSENKQKTEFSAASNINEGRMGIVPGVIRHTSAPTHSIVYYCNKPIQNK